MHAEDKPSSAAPTARQRMTRFEFIASACAVLVSILSLAVTWSSNKTQERMLAASVWPTLDVGTGNRADDGSDVINVSLGNPGVGPARIQSFQMVYKDKSVTDAGDLIRRCCAEPGTALSTITSSVRGRVIKAGESVDFLRFVKANNPEAVWQALNRERFKLVMKACFCSVLDDCWELVSDENKSQTITPVRMCPAVPLESQWDG
jgi:hypothetical protein